MALEPIATNTYDFERIRTTGLTYVDKTGLLYPLVEGSMGNQFFLSRPRRFGKSLLCSTIQKLFEGRRDLFEGLAIDGLPWDWSDTHPVLRLDMSLCSGETLGEVEASVEFTLRREAERLGVSLRDGGNLRDRFAALVEDLAAASPSGQVVLLVDEYDKPLTSWVGLPEVAPFQAFLKSFYSVVKATESKQRFCLMTGVSKFSKASIFSDLNNLTDLSMSPFATTLLGYTHEEVRVNFPGRLAALAEVLETDVEGAFTRLVGMYDGYCFDERMVRVFNPVSLGRALVDMRLRSYWFETGAPGWLMSYARKEPIDLDELEVPESALGAFEPASPHMPVVLFQTGYLTVKGFEQVGRSRTYRLGFPNHEVQDGFSEWLADTYTHAGQAQASGWALACHRALHAGDADGFMESLESFFASIGYDLTDRLTEQAYQCVAVAILRFIGIYLDAEVTTSRGRIDMVMRGPGRAFVMEMKVASGEEAGEGAARAAIAQIRERGYAEPSRASGGEVLLLGVAFDCLTHNVGAWVSEAL